MTLLSRWTIALTIAGFAATAQAEPNVPGRTQGPPQANEVHVGVGVVCNSSQQVARYLAAKADSSIEDAIQLVNNEENDASACGMAMVAFEVGARIGDIRVPDGVMHVTQITIKAVATDNGWQQVSGKMQYTAFFEKFEEV